MVYVPHIKGDRLRWHRTAKAAVLDMTIDPIDTEDPCKITETNELVKLDEEDVFRRNANARCRTDHAQAERTFTGITTLLKVALAFEHLRSTKAVRFGFYNYVQQPIAYAFTLAKLGRMKEAKLELERSAYADDAKLHRRLTEELARTEPT